MKIIDQRFALGVILASLPCLAQAHGNGLFFIVVGIPYAVIAFLIFAAILITTAGKGNRGSAAGGCIVSAPCWGLLFAIPMMSDGIMDNEVEWSIGLPSLLLLAALVILIRRKQRAREAARRPDL